MLTIQFRGGNQQVQADFDRTKRGSRFLREAPGGTSPDPGLPGLHLRIPLLDPLLRPLWPRGNPQPPAPMEGIREGVPRAGPPRWGPRGEATPAGHRAFLREKAPRRYAQVRSHLHEADVRSGRIWRGVHYQVVQARSQT